MIICSIVPNNLCEWMYDKNYAMLMTSAFRDMQHRQKYIAEAIDREDCYKILKADCEVTLEEFFADAQEARVNEVIVSYAELADYLDYMREHKLVGHYNLQVVCDGQNLEEFQSRFSYLESLPEVDVIGLPKSLSAWCEGANRGSLFEIWGHSSKKIHLLGFWYSLKELLDMPYDYLQKIRSADTTIFALNAISGTHALQDRQGVLHLEHEYKELIKPIYDLVCLEYYRLLYEKAEEAGALGQ